MTATKRNVVLGSLWTILGFGVTQAVRLGTNIVLTRLLAPEIFGIMTIVNSLRTGFELFSDVGISQNIVQSRNGDDPRFYNTAWTVQLTRGAVMGVISALLSPVVADIYKLPILASLVPVIGVLFVLTSFNSTAIFTLQKHMQIGKRNVFDIIVEVLSSLLHIVFAYFYPTVWALLMAIVAITGIRAAISHFLLADIHNRLMMYRPYLKEIVGYGKWVFIASIVFFLASYVDRLYLGTAVPLAVLGVYGIARTLSDTFYALAARLAGLVVFPFFARNKDVPRPDLRGKVNRPRWAVVLLAAVAIAGTISCADLIVKILYDRRYWDATWMLPVLFTGSWFAVLSNLNESSLLGFGKPLYSALANSAKLAVLVIGLPLALRSHGVLGAVCVASLAEVGRYCAVAVGSRREQFSFLLQDLSATVVMLGLVALVDLGKAEFGIQTLYDSLKAAL
jgi:O-antigen/teichoic acid export membrane protein